MRIRTHPLPSRLAVLLGVAALAVGPRAARAQGAGAIVGEVREAGSGAPLPGAQVYVPGTGVGQVTDSDGRFRIPGLSGGRLTLRVELLGYRTVDRPVVVEAGRSTALDVTLERDYLRLDRIVVTGTPYGARAREVAHSVATIDPDQIAEPVATVDQLLTGRLPGVTVQQGSGLAGSGSQIRLRGNVSVALDNEPLVYVDGVRVRSEGYPRNAPAFGDPLPGPNDSASPLNDLDPADIERVEVVKGPAATTLYGAEAASGVVQIFTRRGRAGPPEWRARVDQEAARVQKFGTDGDPYLGLSPWLDDAWRQRYSVSVGGGGAVRYYASGSYDHDGGILPNDGERRTTARLNLDAEPARGLAVRLSAFHAWHDIESTPAGINQSSLIVNVLRGPTNYIGDTTRMAIDRLLDYDLETDIGHTLVALNATHSTTSAWTNRVGLGYDRAASRFLNLRPVGYVLAPGGVLSDERWTSRILTAEYVGDLSLELPRELTNSLAWGAQSVTTDVRSQTGYAEGFEEGEPATVENGDLSLETHSRTRIRESGAFVQDVVGLRERYYLTAGFRVDGSTAFGDRLGLQAYPRIGASYVISEEPFWSPALGRVKLRASYGYAGRAPDVVSSLRTWQVTDFAGDSAFVPGAVGNDSLAPERTSELEVGLDGSFLGDRLVAAFSVYRQRTTDALFPVAQIPSEGFSGSQLANVGALRNDGLELSLRGTVLERRSIGLDAGVYLYTNHSEVTSLGGAAPLNVDDGAWILEGEPAPVLRGALVKNADEVADPVLELDHVYGPNLPTRTVGLSLDVRLPRGIEVSARGEYEGGHYLYDNVGNHLARRDRYAPCAGAYALRAEGHPERLTAWERVWCVAANVPRNQGPIYPADFLRLRELTLSVPLPAGFPAGARSVVVVSARNFWTWKNDDFLVFDPEMSGREGTHARARMVDAEIPSPATFGVSLRMTR